MNNGHCTKCRNMLKRPKQNKSGLCNYCYIGRNKDANSTKGETQGGEK